MQARCFVFTACLFFVAGVFGDDVTTVSVKEGDSVPLNTGVTKQHEAVLWYFNDTRIALINGKASKSCLYDGEGGIFSGRLDVDYETGSLTITNIRSEHTGRYELEIIRSKSSGTSQRLNRNSKCNSTKITRKVSSMGDTIKTFSVSVSGPAKTKEESHKMRKEQSFEESMYSVAVFSIFLGVVLLLCAAYCIFSGFLLLRNDCSGFFVLMLIGAFMLMVATVLIHGHSRILNMERIPQHQHHIY